VAIFVPLCWTIKELSRRPPALGVDLALLLPFAPLVNLFSVESIVVTHAEVRNFARIYQAVKRGPTDAEIRAHLGRVHHVRVI
jgi:hypothetical protein